MFRAASQDDAGMRFWDDSLNVHICRRGQAQNLLGQADTG